MIIDFVSRETNERLETLARLVRKWSPRINLVSSATLSKLEDRHIIDSAQLWQIKEDSVEHWVDLGSGGGFPGLVIAILRAELQPSLRITLVEADARKCAFLRSTLAELRVEATVIARRLEHIEPLNADILSARALAPLPKLLDYAERHMKSSGVALFPKGANVTTEIANALDGWAFDCDRVPSRTNPQSSILKIRGIERVRPDETPAAQNHSDSKPKGRGRQDHDNH